MSVLKMEHWYRASGQETPGGAVSFQAQTFLRTEDTSPEPLANSRWNGAAT